MKRIVIRVVPAFVLLVAAYAWVAPLVSGQASPMPSTKNGEWPMYTADLRGSKLAVAWRVKTENKGNRTPRWEAEPNYGIRVERPAAAPGAPPAGGGINFPGGTGRRALAEGLEGLPIVKPPYGVLITKTLVVAGDPQFTAPAGRARGAMLRAYDKQTGAQLAEVLLPAPIVGMPMTYSLAGRQYIVVGVSGGNYTGEYISLALPQSEIRPAARQ